MGSRLTFVVFAAASITVCSACATGAPRIRPVKVGDVDTGPGSLKAVRQQLAGTWTLVSYHTYETGTAQPLDATGELTYDEFSNLTLHGELRQPDQKGERRPLLLNYTGRSTLDVSKHELQLLDINSTGADLPRPVADQVNLDLIRKYEFRGQDLVLTIIGPDGKPTADSVWHKR